MGTQSSHKNATKFKTGCTVCVYIYIYIYIYIYSFIYIYIYMYIYICDPGNKISRKSQIEIIGYGPIIYDRFYSVYIYIYVYVYMCMYIYIYI